MTEERDGVREMVEAACLAYTELSVPQYSFLREKGLGRDISISRMQTALESLGIPLSVLAAVRRGEWKAVPREVTSDMVIAGLQASLDFMATHGIDRHSPFDYYPNPKSTIKHVASRMLSAAPLTPDE